MRSVHLPIVSFFVFMIALTGVQPLPAAAQQEPLETFAVDLADRHISITTGFNGADLLIFGAISRGEVVLVIEGEPETYRVRKKNRVGGIWVNNERRDLTKLPNFYVVASSSDVLSTLSTAQKVKNRIGYDNIASDISIFDAHAREFYQSLITLKENSGLYQILSGSIDVAKSGLFRVDVRIPAAVKPGNYTIRALGVVDGKIHDQFQTALSVNKVGFGADIYYFAHEYPNSYGIVAIIISILSGLLANFLFNRRKG